MAIPVIDLNQFPDPQEYKKLREASEEWGCFKLVNHKIPTTLMSEMKMVTKSLLDLPVEIKKNNTDDVAGGGYIGNPLFETLGLYGFGSAQAVQKFCSQLDASSYQREVIEKYVAATHEQIEDIGCKLAESYELDSDSLKGWPCMLRINKYNFTPECVGSFENPVHTDSGLLTLLHPDDVVAGLEVMDKSGAFTPVDPIPGTLIVHIGDIAQAWSNGRLYNVKHRVKCLRATTRISIASFIWGPKEEAVEARPEFVDSEHPRLYVPFTFEEYKKLKASINSIADEALELLRVKS